MDEQLDNDQANSQDVPFAGDDGKEIEPPPGVDNPADELEEKMDKEITEQLQEEAEVQGNEKKIHTYKHFVIHESTGKVEILDKIIPGIVTYTFNPVQVTPKDIRYMIEAIEDGADLNSQESVKIMLEPKKNIGYADVILDIKNRSNLKIGTMQLWRYNK